MKKLFFIILSLVILAGCEPKINELAPIKGSADFSRYLSVGNSLTAGFVDAALYHTGQQYSFPNILAEQFKLVGGGAFVQPVVNSEFGVEFPGSPYKLVLSIVFDCKGVPSLGPAPAIGARDPLGPVGYLVNNMGIPMVRSTHMVWPGYALANPYYARFASNPTNMVIQEFPLVNATFFSLWLGSNDVLGYAMVGGVGDSITSLGTFSASYAAVVMSLIDNNAKGVLANLADVTSIPFFNTIPYNGLVLTDTSLVDQINFAMTFVFHLPFVYHIGPNPFLIPDPACPPPFHVRQMVPGELVLLTVPQDSMKCFGMGIISAITHLPYPIPDKYTLTLQEITNIQNATAAYNQVISGLAFTHELGMVDMNTRLKNLETGIIWDGIEMTTKFVTGGVFSLDGIHLNPRGNALVANYFIEEINDQYGSTIPLVNITNYPGCLFP